MLDLADFTVQEQPADNLIVAIARPWYNGSYTIAAKSIKSLELHYTMIQFLIKQYITWLTWIYLVSWNRNNHQFLTNKKTNERKPVKKEKIHCQVLLQRQYIYASQVQNEICTVSRSAVQEVFFKYHTFFLWSVVADFSANYPQLLEFWFSFQRFTF